MIDITTAEYRSLINRHQAGNLEEPLKRHTKKQGAYGKWRRDAIKYVRDNLASACTLQDFHALLSVAPMGSQARANVLKQQDIVHGRYNLRFNVLFGRGYTPCVKERAKG